MSGEEVLAAALAEAFDRKWDDPDLRTGDTFTIRDHEFEVVDMVGFEGKAYAILLPFHAEPPQECTDEDHEAFILRVSEDGKALEVIEDEAEFNRVVAHLESLPE